MALADGKECGKTNFHGLRDLNPMSDITAAAEGEPSLASSPARARARSRSLAVGFGRSPENSVGVAAAADGRKRGARPSLLPSRRRVGNGFEFPFRGINWG